METVRSYEDIKSLLPKNCDDNTNNNITNDNNVNKKRKISNKNKKRNKKRCNKCRKRLTLVEKELECKCNQTYCIKHLHNHECKYNYNEEFKKHIKSKNVKVIGEKIDKI